MFILGLTGSIGMGKSETARAFARAGAAVFDADASVHALLAPGGEAVAEVARAFPECVRSGPRGTWADREVLAAEVFSDPARLARLEAILHPLTAAARDRFLRRAARRRLAVLDVPLLFETGGERRCDAVAVVTAPRFLQIRRALRRAGMTAARLAGVRARQVGEAEKIRAANFVIRTGLGRRRVLCAVRGIVKMLASRRGVHWPPRRPAAVP